MMEFLAAIAIHKPKFLAMHCQEVGGKNFEECMQFVNDFVKLLLASPELQRYDRLRVYLDEDFRHSEKFTALGNFYLIHEELQNVTMWDFAEKQFVPVNDKQIHSGRIEDISTKEKDKFPQNYFPDCKWSRKGFIRTRWCIKSRIFDLINIHLFHDASNLVAMESTPSSYRNSRHKVLEHTLERFDTDEYQTVPHFIFGDFNFRLDAQAVVQRLTVQTTPVYVKTSKNELKRIMYTEKGHDDKVVLTIEKKLFDHGDKHSEAFVVDNGKWLADFDNELEEFQDRLTEYPHDFPPSYPYVEDVNDGLGYMKTRLPGWCDRVLFSHTARALIDQNHKPLYSVIGAQVCMGDHKPVILSFSLACGAPPDCSPTGAPWHLQTAPGVRQDGCPAGPTSETRFIKVKQNGCTIKIYRETTV
ncbi:PREDICTED: type I inositol 1,4,5-trisphosphate 5-phosphatase-like isoform X2 [Priapulus caudatus]|uniref:inositol-polyphosphate 5-phosphatase n=1 Tax=Priapulus caudatus TaxID=37621 RepID=A0ABM1DUU6_PRICU|nr:PREDICTED: type I inositol 1,4,5-trisphosphate 5-phosphatase-like isoform X2 [Priapulus caudatus]